MSYRYMSPAIRQLNEALDRTRGTLNLPNDGQLAERIGVSARLVSFWRNGKLGRTNVVLVAVLTGDLSILPPTDDQS